jgi:hypothetical protein
MRQRLTLIAAAAALSLFAATTAVLSAEPFRFLISKWTLTKTCNFANAQLVDVRAFVKDPAAYDSKCVKLNGYVGSRALFASMKDYYALYGSSWHDDEGGVRVGLYADEQVRRALGRAYKHQASVIGKASTCRDLYADFTMVMGYCHYVGGPILLVSDFAPVSPTPTRALRSELPAAQIDIDELVPSRPLYGKIQSMAMQWLDAIRRSDGQALVGLNRYATMEEVLNPDSILHKLLMSERQSYGLITNASAAVPPFKAFVFREDEASGTSAYGCFCKTGNCEGQWPAQTHDASANPAWPYACFHYEVYSDDARPLVYAGD